MVQHAVPRVDWLTPAAENRLVPCGPVKMFGRCAAMKLKAPHTDFQLVYKLSRQTDTIHTLIEEARWLSFLYPAQADGPYRFDIPRPLRVRDRFVFRLKKRAVDA